MADTATPTTAIVDLSGEQDHEMVADLSAGEIVSAEVMNQIVTARRFPRSVTRFRKSVLAQVTLNVEIAAQCSYALPRGGKVLEGPSVRFAEVVAAAWGNIRCGARVVEERDRFVVAEGVAWDLETNSAIAMQTQRRITDSKGRRYNDDMVGVTGNAAAAVAMRNAILRAVPKALWNDLYENAKAVALGDVKTLAQRRNNALAAFKPFGVTEAQVCAALSVAGIADIGLEQLSQLQGFLNSITTEGVDPEEIFPPAETKAARSAPPPVEAKAVATGKAAPTVNTSPPAASAAAPSKFADIEVAVANMIAEAGGPGDIDALPRFFEEEFAQCTAAERAKLEAMITEAAKKYA
jgi:hypothetical protein